MNMLGLGSGKSLTYVGSGSVKEEPEAWATPLLSRSLFHQELENLHFTSFLFEH
jgi:hypothetical protein